MADTAAKFNNKRKGASVKGKDGGAENAGLKKQRTEKNASADGSKKGSFKGSNKGGHGKGDLKKGSFKGKGDFKKGGSFKGKGGDKKSFKGKDGKENKEGGEGGDAKSKLLTKKDRKELKKQRRAERPNGEVITGLNKLYKTPLKELKKADREARCGELLQGCQGKIKQVVAKHDAARVLQILIKHGSAAQRSQVFEELKGTFVANSMNNYAHYVILKLLQYGKAEEKRAIQREFVGHIAKLAMHAEGAKVLDYMFASAKTAQRAEILEEFYGKEFALLRELKADDAKDAKKENKKDTTSAVAKGGLAELLRLRPDKKEAVLASIQKTIDKAADKQMLMFRFMHTLIWEYLQQAPLDKLEEMLANLSKNVQPFHHSPDGVRVACFCLTFGGAKDRKALVKSIKGNAVAYAGHVDAHYILIRALQVVDDTVLLEKNIVADLVEKIDEVVESPFGVRVLLSLLAPLEAVGTYLNKHDRAMMEPPQLSEEVAAGLKNTSKKDPAVRRDALLMPLLPAVLGALEKKIEVALRDLSPSQLLYETMRELSLRTADTDAEETKEGRKIMALKPRLDECLAKITTLCAHEDLASHPLQDQVAHYVLKHLLLHLKPNSHTFAANLYDAIEPQLVLLAKTNRGAFVISALIQKADKTTAEKVKSELMENRKELEALAEKVAGVQVLLKALDGSATDS